MASPRSVDVWQVLRPVLSVVALLLMPLVWGDEGCGQGVRTGFALFGKNSAVFLIPILLAIGVSDLIARRARAEVGLLLHGVSFVGALYLGVASVVHVLFLYRARWPAPVCMSIIVTLAFDCARRLVLAILALGRTPGTAAKPLGTTGVLLGTLALMAGALLLLFTSPATVHAPPARPSSATPEIAETAETAVTAVTPGPLRSLPFANRAAFTEPTERQPALRGKLPETVAQRMWRGSVFASPRGVGFGRHIPQATYLLQGGEWLLVHAESGLWLLETATLARRARLNTGTIVAVDVTPRGDRIAYASCAVVPWTRPCDLVVLRFPELTELHRSEFAPAHPHQIRLSPSKPLFAVSRGYNDGATVIAVGGQTLFSGHILPNVIAAIPLAEKRVAALDRDGRLAIEEVGRREALYLGTADALLMDFPFKFRLGRDSGELVFDEAADRLLVIGKEGAIAIEGVSGEKPHLGKPLTREDLDRSGLRNVARHYFGEDLDARFNMKQFHKRWQTDDILGFALAKGEVVGIQNHYDRIVRASPDGALRSVEFDEGDKISEQSYTQHDLVMLHPLHDDRHEVRRVPLSPPALDVTPAIVGELASEHGPEILPFPNGDRAILTFDKADKASLVRLPRGGTLSPAEPLSVVGLQTPKSKADHEGRYARLVEGGQVLEITAQKTQILATDGHWPETLVFDAKSQCFALSDGPKRRLIGPDCAVHSLRRK